MKRLADGVWQLKGFPPDAINAYLVEDVLIDAATRRAGSGSSSSSRGTT